VEQQVQKHLARDWSPLVACHWNPIARNLFLSERIHPQTKGLQGRRDRNEGAGGSRNLHLSQPLEVSNKPRIAHRALTQNGFKRGCELNFTKEGLSCADF